ncbi:MAG: hypothetical protein ACXW4H_06475 [Candidatus Limnocylindrales bacterium]
MSGYATSARLHGGSTRFVAAGSKRRVAPGGSVETSPGWLDGERVELAGRPVGERLAARWDDLRETWSQTTFFLFDAESWR